MVISRQAILLGGMSLLVSLAISLTLTPRVRRWALRRGFVDDPGGGETHKTHRAPTAFGGGIAIAMAVLGPLVMVLLVALAMDHAGGGLSARLTAWAPDWPHWLGGVRRKVPEGLAIVAGGLVMHLVGLLDDHRPLPALVKLAIQIAAAGVLTAGFGILAGEALGRPLSIVLTTLWIVTLTNAFNFMDNMDGLSAGVAAITAIVLAIAAFIAGQLFVPCLLLLLAGAVIGFGVYNFPPASIFMGDAGSLLVGYLLAVLTVLTTFYDERQGSRPFGVLVPLLVFAVPLYDLVSVMIHRYRAGRSILRSDRGHFSHRLVGRGMSSTSAVLTIYLATTATALPAILLPQLEWAAAVLILGQCACVIAIIAILEARHGS